MTIEETPVHRVIIVVSIVHMLNGSLVQTLEQTNMKSAKYILAVWIILNYVSWPSSAEPSFPSSAALNEGYNYFLGHFANSAKASEDLRMPRYPSGIYLRRGCGSVPTDAKQPARANT